MIVPQLPLGSVVEAAVYWISDTFGFALDAFSGVFKFFIDIFKDVLMAMPPLLFVVLLAVLAYVIGRKDWKLALGTALGFIVILSMDLWEYSMETIALVISSAALALIIGIPLGILAAKSETLYRILRPILDLMQTMPSFVYLIPAVIFFGLGNVPGMIATVVFSMPPAIRLTTLGITQVPTELVEVADAFGSTSWQKLIKVEIPVALKTIMAGVNQCIMLALSMVVIASMIGARGLGYQVLIGIQRVDIGLGFEAGLGIVIIAIVLDRLTQHLTPK
ncbi:ABC transporter permease [Methanohalophilus mahii]|uniref:Binding-protein-dependent transport systems inner membrane component n=1 Tax=Methanohalophilus mahii (strain ATCC 35705 / DSM 5219 / SLP) TaxID=547558 RepID=D5E9M0_METMS|nr:proline/glycine betaine ABC transporter permease [Methanohalophilus mahii]ADE35871.1 binding-protein-dependent transport systems inner membrane component [Methanohalophilus mahii DSM 5219]